MKQKTRQLSGILFALTLMLAVPGCGSAAGPQSAPEPPAASATEQSSASGGAGASPQAQEWKPDRPITMLVGMKAGGGIDAMARALAPEMSKYLGVDVVVQNMEGSGSGTAADYMMGQPADGYTIMANSSSVVAFSTTENSDVTYHEMGILAMPFQTHNPAILVKGDSPISSMEELIEKIKSEPTTASHAGVGSVWHIPEALIASELGALDKVTFVPYPSGQETVMAVAKGEVDWCCCGASLESGELIREGMVKPLAIYDNKPYTLEGYGEIPPLTSTIPSIEKNIVIGAGWRGIGYKLGTPENVVAALTAATKAAIESDSFQSLLEKNGITAPALYGEDAQKLYEQSSRVQSWLLYDLGDGTRSPDEAGVPRPE